MRVLLAVSSAFDHTARRAAEHHLDAVILLPFPQNSHIASLCGDARLPPAAYHGGIVRTRRRAHMEKTMDRRAFLGLTAAGALAAGAGLAGCAPQQSGAG
ncbi:MAG: twin-arginine translocation signal domain-containing protein, partial [Eggerthellaceae bacterium]